MTSHDWEEPDVQSLQKKAEINLADLINIEKQEIYRANQTFADCKKANTDYKLINQSKVAPC